VSERADVVVIGMGPGGEEAAAKLAQAGLDVVGVEKELLGGECPYWACVPTKMMVRGTDLLAEGRRIPGMAGSATVMPDWAPVARRIRDEATDNWDDRTAVERFEADGGRFVRGEGRFEGPGLVSVDGTTFEVSRAVVVATGTRPAIPPVPGLDQVDYWTNRGAVKTEEVPSSLVVMGGGSVGCEFAQVFARYGSRVTVVEGLRHLIPNEEIEACDLLQKIFAGEGIDVRTGAKAERVDRAGDGIAVTLDDGSQVSGERLLVATGRKTDLAAVRVGTLGLDETARWLDVDDHMRVQGADRVWAIGDVVGGGFTHMAMYHAGIAVADILGQEVPGAEDFAVPRVTFTDPEVGAVGLTERAAREKGLDVRTGTYPLPKSTRGWIHKAGNAGFIKLVEDAQRGVLIGATSTGPVGGEVLSMLTLAVHARVSTTDLRRMVYAYPTFHRAVEAALDELAGSRGSPP
jgi:pyruvate/2-oxoglutarate dehydrogenase complex dihydrolipoamide dehydrogenase (E3) component